MGVFDYTGGDWGDGSGWGDWGSLGGDNSGLGDGSFDWSSLGGDDSSGGSSWWSKLFSGSGSGSGGSSGSGIFGALLSGLGGAADNYEKGVISKEAVEEQGKQQRKTAGFEADLLDYYKQKDKVRKRTALDTYGQFSTMNKWAPGAKPAAPIDMPLKPTAG
jgi:hypothetical protein